MNLRKTAICNKKTHGYIQHLSIIERFIKYTVLKGTHQGHQARFLALQRTPQGSHHEPESVVQMALELRQTWCCDPFPEKTVLQF